MVEPFAENGELIGYDGSQVISKMEMIAHLQPIFANHPTPIYISKVRSVQFLGTEGAVLRAVAGMVPRGKEELEPSLHAHHTLVAEKQQGEWHTVLFQNTPAQFHGRPELIEQWTEELTAELSKMKRES